MDEVFINVPFDAGYEPLFLALIAGLVGLGLSPRCVVEVPRSSNRLDRLLSLMEGCPYSIHDLSRIGLSKAGQFRVPRFNMPFELGLAVALRERHRPSHQWCVFERVPHRLIHSLSDLNGFDQYTHEGKATVMLEELASIFCELPAPPIRDPKDLLVVYRRLQRFRRDRLPRNVFAADPFRKLVAAARIAVLETPGARTLARKGRRRPRA